MSSRWWRWPCSCRELGQEVRLCAPPDFREWIESLGIPSTPIGPEVRKTAAASPSATPAPPSPEQRRQLVEATVATQFETITAAAQGCDIIVAATALQVAAARWQSRWDPLRLRRLLPDSPAIATPRATPVAAVPGQTPAPATADNRELWAQDAERFNDLRRRAQLPSRIIGLAPVSDVRSHMFTDRPWLAADPTLAPWPDPADQDVFQTGAWILPDERPLSPELEAFLDAGEPPVYFGFGSMRAPQDLSQAMIRRPARSGAVRSCPEGGPTCHWRTTNPTACPSARSTCRRSSRGSPRSSTTAARARRPWPRRPEHPRSSSRRSTTSTTGHREPPLGIGTAHAPGMHRPPTR